MVQGILNKDTSISIDKTGPSPWVSNDGWTVSEQWVEIYKNTENWRVPYYCCLI